MDWISPHRRSFHLQNNLGATFPPPQGFRSAVFSPMAMSPMDVPFMVNPPQVAFGKPPIFPVPPYNQYPFGTRVPPLLPSGSTQYPSFPRYPVGSGIDSCHGYRKPGDWYPRIEKTIHNTIANSLFQNLSDGITRKCVAALVEVHNSQAHPRDMVKIEHPTKADNNIEAAITRIESLQRALKDAEKLHDTLKGALWREDDAQLHQQGLEKLEKAFSLLVGAEKLSEMLENWLIRELMSDGAFDNTDDFAEIEQKARETEDSWVEQIRKILAQASDMSEDKDASDADTENAHGSVNMSSIVGFLNERLLQLTGMQFKTLPPQSVGDEFLAAMEAVVEYPRAGLTTSTRDLMEKFLNKGKDEASFMINNLPVEYIAKYLLNISASKVDIDDTLVECSRRALAYLRGSETERDVALRTLREKQLRLSYYGNMLVQQHVRPCNVGYGETLTTWVSNNMGLINEVDGAQEKFEAPFQPLDDSPDWAEVYVASLLYDYGKLASALGEQFDEIVIKIVTDLTNRINNFEGNRVDFDLCEGKELLRQLTDFDAAETPATLESLRPLGLITDPKSFYGTVGMPARQFSPSLLEHQSPQGIDHRLVLGYLEHIYWHRHGGFEVDGEIVEVIKRIMARAKASEEGLQVRPKHDCGGDCSNKPLDRSNAEEVLDFDFVEAESTNSKGKGKGKGRAIQ